VRSRAFDNKFQSARHFRVFPTFLLTTVMGEAKFSAISNGVRQLGY